MKFRYLLKEAESVQFIFIKGNTLFFDDDDEVPIEILKNPTSGEVYSMVRKANQGDVRGVVIGTDLYVWSGAMEHIIPPNVKTANKPICYVYILYRPFLRDMLSDEVEQHFRRDVVYEDEYQTKKINIIPYEDFQFDGLVVAQSTSGGDFENVIKNRNKIKGLQQVDFFKETDPDIIYRARDGKMFDEINTKSSINDWLQFLKFVKGK